MLRFINCPSCSAQVEALPGGTTCWNCGHVIPGNEPHVNASNDQETASPVQFISCKHCKAQVEPGASPCWSCGGDPCAALATTALATDGKTGVPFGDLAREPPPKKPSFLEFIAKAITAKPEVDVSGADPTEEQKKEEREAKRSRALILFHCPRCGDYFKVLFKKVHGGVKCPVCKDMKMKIPYFCARCKQSWDFDTLDRHVCKTCNIDLILDPNYE